MEKNNHQKEDFLVKKYLKEISDQKAPLNFTNSIMDLIALEEQSVLANQKPLISKKIWVLVASFVGVCFYFVFEKGNSLLSFFPEADFSFLEKIKIPNLLPSVAISNSILLICGIFTLMIFVQIFYLKNHFERKINL